MRRAVGPQQKARQHRHQRPGTRYLSGRFFCRGPLCWIDADALHSHKAILRRVDRALDACCRSQLFALGATHGVLNLFLQWRARRFRAPFQIRPPIFHFGRLFYFRARLRTTRLRVLGVGWKDRGERAIRFQHGHDLSPRSHALRRSSAFDCAMLAYRVWQERHTSRGSHNSSVAYRNEITIGAARSRPTRSFSQSS